MTLYQALKEAGIETDSHYSDLYFPATPKSLEILLKYPHEAQSSTRFTCQITGKRWVDVPAAFDLYNPNA